MSASLLATEPLGPRNEDLVPKEAGDTFQVLRMTLRRKTFQFWIYNFAASLLLLTSVVGSYLRFNLLSTNIVLGGWDSAFYLWYGDAIKTVGPFFYMQFVQYPQFYSQLLALTGNLVGSMVWAQRILPIFLGIVRIMLMSTVSYRITKNVHVAGLTALLASISVGNLWLVGEYHRSSLAYDLGLVLLLLTSTSATFSKKRCITLLGLLFLLAGTEFETFGLFALVIIMSAMFTKRWTLLAASLISSMFSLGFLLLAFPSWLDWNYRSSSIISVFTRTGYTYHDLVFWSIGSSVLIPLMLLGLLGLYLSGDERKETIANPILILSITVLLVGILSLSVNLGSLAVRSAILLPVPTLLSMGIYVATRILGRISLTVEFRGYSKREGVSFASWRVMAVVGLVLSAATVSGMTIVDDSPYGVHHTQLNVGTPLEFVTGDLMVPFVPSTQFPKLLVIHDYLLAKHLTNPIFMFMCGTTNSTRIPCYPASLFRPYIYDMIGEHFAYIGSFEQLAKLKATVFPTTNPYSQDLTVNSQLFLAVMNGTLQYRTTFPQLTTATNASALLGRPVVYVTPEMYDVPPAVVTKYFVSDGIYIVPSLSDLVNSS